LLWGGSNFRPTKGRPFPILNEDFFIGGDLDYDF